MDQKIVGIAELAVCRAPQQLACLGLGSCVAAIVYDPVAKIGGMVHVLLPHLPNNGKEEKYADSGVRKLVKEMLRKGARKQNLRAKLVGGAQMFKNMELSTSDIGRDNHLSAAKVLHELGIPVVASDVGGSRGRSAYLDTANGRVTVKTAFEPDRII